MALCHRDNPPLRGIGRPLWCTQETTEEERDADITKAAEARSKKEKRKAARQGQKGEEKTDTKEDDHIPDPNPPAYDLGRYVADSPRDSKST